MHELSRGSVLWCWRHILLALRCRSLRIWAIYKQPMQWRLCERKVLSGYYSSWTHCGRLLALQRWKVRRGRRDQRSVFRALCSRKICTGYHSSWTHCGRLHCVQCWTVWFGWRHSGCLLRRVCKWKVCTEDNCSWSHRCRLYSLHRWQVCRCCWERR